MVRSRHATDPAAERRTQPSEFRRVRNFRKPSKLSVIVDVDVSSAHFGGPGGFPGTQQDQGAVRILAQSRLFDFLLSHQWYPDAPPACEKKSWREKVMMIR